MNESEIIHQITCNVSCLNAASWSSESQGTKWNKINMKFSTLVVSYMPILILRVRNDAPVQCFER